MDSLPVFPTTYDSSIMLCIDKEAAVIYLDNAATSFPKPPEVIRAMSGTLEKIGANPGRGGHRLSLCAGAVVESCREALCGLLGMEHPERVLFTASCTEALNLAIGGILHDGDEVICSHAEHNAVMRLLDRYQRAGQITVKVLSPNALGLLEPEALSAAIGPRTALVIICHASNVTGVIQPVSRLGEVCKRHSVPLLVDAAQTAGTEDVRLSALGASMLAMPGHKGLLGPQGVGVLALADDIDPEPLVLGGTGSASESMTQPLLLPDRYESGTVNLPGIAGLLAGVRFVAAHRAEIAEYEQSLASRLREQLRGLPGLRLLGDDRAPRTGMVSFTAAQDTSYLADALDTSGIAVRGGLHCAPSIHRWLGTLRSGAIRASVGVYNTERDIDDTAAVLRRLLTVP